MDQESKRENELMTPELASELSEAIFRKYKGWPATNFHFTGWHSNEDGSWVVGTSGTNYNESFILAPTSDGWDVRIVEVQRGTGKRNGKRAIAKS